MNWVPKLCHLVQEMGEEERVQHLRSAELLSLSSMVIHHCGFSSSYGCLFKFSPFFVLISPA
uniref:Uncharacterized protein n=1 Tax=Rhizophora mucronata TaxID=61149 RepID=A0A2P2MU03_RHIMU